MSRAGALRDYVDEAKISELIEKYKGHALAKFEPDLYNFEEIDFLKIGCVKTP